MVGEMMDQKKDFRPAEKTQLGSLSPTRPIPKDIERPWYSETGEMTKDESIQKIKNEEELACMRASCKLAANILAEVEPLIQAGTCTDEIDEFVHFATVNAGAYPSPLNYGGFRKSVCTSVNEVMCHGVPDDRPLRSGDVVKVDVTCFHRGFHGDTCRTFVVGGLDAVPPKVADLLDAAEQCVLEGVRMAAPPHDMRALGQHVDRYLRQRGYRANSMFIGHGVGREFHSDPKVQICDKPLFNYPLDPGMTFTIEPCVTAGRPDVYLADDGQSYFTEDGLISAQFEHTVLVTETGGEILTIPDPPEVRKRVVDPTPPSWLKKERRATKRGFGKPKFASQRS